MPDILLDSWRELCSVYDSLDPSEKAVTLIPPSTPPPGSEDPPADSSYVVEPAPPSSGTSGGGISVPEPSSGRDASQVGRTPQESDGGYPERIVHWLYIALPFVYALVF